VTVELALMVMSSEGIRMKVSRCPYLLLPLATYKYGVLRETGSRNLEDGKNVPAHTRIASLTLM
jgi:hypothetical protein